MNTRSGSCAAIVNVLNKLTRTEAARSSALIAGVATIVTALAVVKSSSSVLVFATLDTKGREAAFIRDLLEGWRVRTTLVDVGSLAPPTVPPDVTREQIFALAGTAPEAMADRGEAVTCAAEGAARFTREAHARGEVAGVLGLGGSAGTTIATAAMRALPLGVPKVMASTLASGTVRQFVADKDIFMLNTVVDILGINRVSRDVLSQAARAMAGLVTHPGPPPQDSDRPLVAATMFGVTTACVERARAALGGRRLRSADFSRDRQRRPGDGIADPRRAFRRRARPDDDRARGRAGRRLPQCGSGAAHGGGRDGGATGGLDRRHRHGELLRPATVPERFGGRLFHRHNANVTLMRTTAEENRAIGAKIARKLSAATGPVAVLLPRRGVSAIDQTRTAVRQCGRPASRCTTRFVRALPGDRVTELDLHINDPEFAEAAAQKLLDLMQTKRPRARQATPDRRHDVTVDNSRQAILERFRAQIARGEPIVGGGAGTGLSAVSEEAGGIDLLIVYNSGRYRMAGRGSSAGLLAYGNANQIVKEMAYEILPVVKKTPVLAGVNGTDPVHHPRLFLEELRTLGFVGIQNFPTVGLFDGDMRQAFEETGMSYQLEVDIVRLAHERWTC